MESRVGEASTIDGKYWQTGQLTSGSTTELTVAGRADVPTNATAAVLTITVTEPTTPGFVTVFPCGTTTPTTSNLNYQTGDTIANTVIAKIGTDGKICLFTSSTTHLIVDLNGYYPAGASYDPMVPVRLMESRVGEASTIDGKYWQTGTLASGSTTELTVAGRADVPTNATAAVLTITVTEPTTPGFVTVFPCGTTTPTTSNLNYQAGDTIANTVIAKIGTDGKICLFTSSTTHLIVDLNGYYGP